MSFNNTNIDILIAGAFAAFTVDVLIYPLDTIKTRIQSPDYKRLYKHGATNTINRSLFRGLYQGIGSVVIATLPSSGAFFTTYEGTKSLLTRLNLQSSTNSPLLPTPFIHALASSTGELVSCLILTPAEVLKQNAQMVEKSASRSSNSNTNRIPTTQVFDRTATMHAIRRFRHPAQLWRGYTALAARNLPFTAMHFPLFEHVRSKIQDVRSQHGKTTHSLLETGLITAVAAAAAGSVAAVATTPIDVVKTHIMLSAGSSSGDGGRAGLGGGKKWSRSRGGWAVGMGIWQAQGVRGLFRGGLLRGLWTAIGSGLYLGSYESGRRYLEERRVDDGAGKEGS